MGYEDFAEKFKKRPWLSRSGTTKLSAIKYFSDTMEEFNTNKRLVGPNWLMAQIKLLIHSAKMLSNSSFVLYAALETRNLIELIEFDLLDISAKGTDSESFLMEIRGKTGIQQMNKKYKTLKYRYQSFSSAATQAIFEEGSLKKFDFKKSENFCNELSQYIHTYSRRPDEMVFGSEFINQGIALVEDCLNYLISDFFEIIDGHLIYGVFNFNTLTQSVKNEFDKWLNCVDENEDALLQRLIEINKNEYGGIKIKIPGTIPTNF